MSQRLQKRKPVFIAAVCLPLLLALSFYSNAQNRHPITGVVTDTAGLALEGASVLEKGTLNGSTTDAQGKFSISVGPNARLVVTFSGYRSTEIEVGQGTNFNVQLVRDLQELDNVVVTGYGTQRRKEITSAVVSVDSKDFIKGNVSSPIQLLQGKVGGLQIGRAGGNPNQPFTIRLRGLNTISGDASPLIVIDGVLGGSLEALDPSDVESMEILKDASAAAIYGARASAGVIIVTTKSGKGLGQATFNYNGQVSFEEIARKPEIATPEEYKELGGNDLGSSTDWLDLVTRVGKSHVHNFTFGNTSPGGFNYNASVNYRGVNGVLTNATSFEQLNARINLSQRFFDSKLILSSSLAMTSRNEDQGFQQALINALYYNPTAPVFAPDGKYFETREQDRYNPVSINQLNLRHRKLNQQLANFKADFKPAKRFLLSASYTLQRTSELLGDYSSRNAFFGGMLVNGWARRETMDDTYHQFDGSITYNGEAGKLSYVLIAGQSYNYQNIQGHAAANTDFITDEFSYNNLAAGQGISKNGVVPVEGNVAQPQNFVGSAQRESISNAYFARANLNYDDQFFLSASYRREGSSRFGANNRWGNFWAVSGGADLAQIFSIGADQLKLRAGYGVTGTLPNVFYGYLATLGLTSGGYANGEFISGISPASAFNPDLKWEEKAELNFGIDFGFFQRLRGSLDYFVRNTKDLLNVVNVPSPPNPVTTQLRNVGQLRTKGIELQLSYAAIEKKDFSWTIDANLSTAKTILVEFNAETEQSILRGEELRGGPTFGGINPIWTLEGEEIGQIYAQPFVRYEANGDPIVLDKDGNEMVFSPGAFRDNARNVADALPDLFAGLGNNFQYKNFDLSIFLRGTFGHSLVNETRAAFENVSGIGRRNLIVTKGEFDRSIVVPHYSTRYVENASFVKIDNVTIGYTVPVSRIKAIRSLRVYATGQNLVTFTKYKGVDPEVRYFDPPNSTEGRRINSFSGNGLFPGIDRFITFFPTRIYTIGVNIGL